MPEEDMRGRWYRKKDGKMRVVVRQQGPVVYYQYKSPQGYSRQNRSTVEVMNRDWERA